MNGERVRSTEAQNQLETAWHAFEYLTGSRDEKRFRQSYLGHYADRDAFGQELLSRLGADSRLAKLPDWLRAYVRFDGEAVVRDFEAAGHFYIFEAPHHGGTFIFDGHWAPDD